MWNKCMLNNKSGAAKGFTLIEIMVVVVILGVLAALIVPNVIGRPDEARAVTARAEIQQIASALALYRLDNGFYPSSDQGLEALVNKPAGFPEPVNWNEEGYLKVTPEDPWGKVYFYFNEDRTIEVYSLGADRKEGGEGVDADIRLSAL